MLLRCIFAVVFAASAAFSQSMPKIEPGVSEELAKWRAVQYSRISYKLNLTLEKMSPVLKGSVEIHVTQAAYACAEPNCPPLYIVLDWRKLAGHEKDSTISNVSLNGIALSVPPSLTVGLVQPDAGPTPDAQARTLVRAEHPTPTYDERDDHLIFRNGVKMGENVIKLDFTSPILTSGSAITRYIDKEDGSEYIYSLFVPSDASTAFPCFDQPDLKARFTLNVTTPDDWRVIGNTAHKEQPVGAPPLFRKMPSGKRTYEFAQTLPISTYVFAFTAGPWAEFRADELKRWSMPAGVELPDDRHVFVRDSQYMKFGPHADEVFRLQRESIKYLEQYFDYKFPFPKLDLVLIPEFPFGGMEHAGAIFLREDRIIFPAEPTKGDYLTRANLIFHETAHQWFGDTVTMRWFDDLWLKEGFAEFMAYKTLEKVTEGRNPSGSEGALQGLDHVNAWKTFYERNKQAAYATDSTRGTTPIYQKIDNLSAAKSAYGNIVYRKAPSFLRQAEFYLGEDKFQTAVRAFLKKHEFGNATWEDLVSEFEKPCDCNLKPWANQWVRKPGLARISNGTAPRRALGTVVSDTGLSSEYSYWFEFLEDRTLDFWPMNTKAVFIYKNGRHEAVNLELQDYAMHPAFPNPADKDSVEFVFGNYQDYGYGIFLLDDKSCDYVLKHIGEEKDPFLRSMMWGALWDSVREAELDPREYVELAIKQLGGAELQKPARSKGTRADDSTLESDETTIQSLLARVSTALNYYLPVTGALTNVRASATDDLRTRFEEVLLDRLQHAPTAGQRITFYRAYVANASSDKARGVLKQMLRQGKAEPPASAGGTNAPARSTSGKPEKRDTQTSAKPPANAGGSALRTKDKFDIVTRLIILGDPDAPKLLAELEKTETSDDAKRYAYAARAAFGTAENKVKFFNDFISNKDISESWVETAIIPFNNIRQSSLTQPYLERALRELPNLKRTRKIFFVNNWLSAWIGGQRDQKALDIINKFLADNPQLDNDLRLKVLENMDLIERAVKIRSRQ